MRSSVSTRVVENSQKTCGKRHGVVVGEHHPETLGVRALGVVVELASDRLGELRVMPTTS